MKKVIVSLLVTSLLALGACEQQTGAGSAEPVQVKMKYPVSVEQARKAATDAQRQPTIEVSPAMVETPTPTPETPTQAILEATKAQLSTEDTTSEAEDATSELENLTTELDPVEEPIEDSCFGEGTQYGTYYEDCYDVPQEQLIPLGIYHIVHYSAEAMGNAIGAAQVDGGLVENTSIAMPDPALLGCWVEVENYGRYRVDDISPDGVADIFHWLEQDAVGDDWQQVYLVVMEE